MSEYVKQNGCDNTYSDDEPWIILPAIELQIQKKINDIGTPLKEWNIRINFGIKTGFNEAFIIDGTKRDELIAQDQKSAEIIRPILRGRDIKKYGYQDSGLWLIYVPWHFPLHADSSISGPSLLAENEFKKQYPAVYNHLLSYKIPLSLRNKAETGIRYEWYVLQRWGANYWEDFSKQKIVWGEISDKAKFTLDETGEYYTEATAFIMIGESLKYLLAFLNSKVSEYSFGKIGTTTGMGTIRWKKYKIETFPIPKLSAEKQEPFNILVDEILLLKKDGKKTTELEQKIDSMIYSLLNFDEEEIRIIENIT